MKQNLFKFLTVLLLALGLAACGGSDDNGNDGNSGDSSEVVVLDAPASDCFNPEMYSVGTVAELLYTFYDKSGEAFADGEVRHTIKDLESFDGRTIANLVEHDEITSVYGLGEEGPGTQILSRRVITVLDKTRDFWTSTTLATENAVGTPGDLLQITETIFEPGWEQLDFSFSEAGDSRVEKGIQTTTMRSSDGSFTIVGPTVANYEKVTVYHGQERVSVPAGTFTACHFSYEMDGKIEDAWHAVGSGVPVQFGEARSKDDPMLLQKLRSGSTVNGHPVPVQ